MTQHAPGPCGCKTDVNEVLYYPFIVYCPLHASASEMLWALEEMVEDTCTYAAKQPGEFGRRVVRARAAIRAATGGA